MSGDAGRTDVVGRLEPVEATGTNGKSLSLGAKVDTGAARSSIAATLVEDLGMPEKLGGTTTIRSGGSSEERELVPVHLSLVEYENLQLVSNASINDRSEKDGDNLIGYTNLNTWDVNADPSVTNWGLP